MSKRKSVPNIMDQLQGLPPPKSNSPTPPAKSELVSPTSPPPKKQSPRANSSHSERSKRRSRTTRSGRPVTKRITTKERLAGRATYDIGKELKETLLDESIELGIPASQLAKYLLIQAWNIYIEGDIPPPELIRSNSPKFRNMIDFGE